MLRWLLVWSAWNYLTLPPLLQTPANGLPNLQHEHPAKPLPIRLWPNPRNPSTHPTHRPKHSPKAPFPTAIRSTRHTLCVRQTSYRRSREFAASGIVGLGLGMGSMRIDSLAGLGLRRRPSAARCRGSGWMQSLCGAGSRY